MDKEPAVFRIWALECPFRKDGTPVVGSFGRSAQSVVIMTSDTWARLVQEVPQLKTTRFEVGQYE